LTRFEHLPGLLDPALCTPWAAAAGRAIEAARAAPRAPPGWSPTSSSLRFEAVPDVEAAVLWHAIRAGGLLRACAPLLGSDDLACDLDQSWWRRQYPLAAMPPSHRPHAWHQDGALGHDFAARPEGTADAHGLLRIVTCWIALVPCGVEAPGLELARGAPLRVLGLAELDDASLRRRCGLAAFERPVLAAGDALVFASEVPHRTHLHAAMTRNRTSLELRFFDAARVPERLAGDRAKKL
jgi:hypothetical protein